MRVIRRIYIAFCVLLTIASGASTAMSQTTKKPAATAQGLAAVHFLRPMPVLGWGNSPDITIDGRLVGELSVGTYFVVRVPHGQHTIGVRGGLDGGYESELQVETGKTYFIEVGPRGQPAPGAQLITRALAGNTFGQPMPGRGFMGAHMFFLLGDQEGRAKIATLRKVAR